jgi:two-component system OmpR family response regulator
MLPGLSGEAVLAAIRERDDTPVLIASAKRSDLERIAGLRMGADDYLAKPFNPHELTARVAAILRRSRGEAATPAGPTIALADVNGQPLSFDGGRLVVDPASRRFTLSAGDPADRAGPVEGRLTPGEIGLLAALARRPGAVLTRDQLLEAVTRRPDEVYDRVIDVHVANLRRKLGDDAARPWLIETIPQTGYRLVAAPDAAA